jgi:hypothetical protein
MHTIAQPRPLSTEDTRLLRVVVIWVVFNDKGLVNDSIYFSYVFPYPGAVRLFCLPSARTNPGIVVDHTDAHVYPALEITPYRELQRISEGLVILPFPRLIGIFISFLSI